MKTKLSFKNLKSLVTPLFLAFSILFAFSTNAQISFLGSTSAYTSGINSIKLTFNHTVNPGTNFLVVTVTTKDNPIVSIKFGQQTLTMAVTKVQNSMNVAIYYLIFPQVVTGVVEINTSGGTDITGGADNYGNVDINNPVIQTASSLGASAAPSMTVSSNAGELVIDAIGTASNQANKSASQSLAHSNYPGSYPNASSYKVATSSSTTTNWTLPGGADQWAMAGIVIRYASLPGILPLKLLNFYALLNNSKVELGWKTTAEINMNYFVIEKSQDGTNFSDQGIVYAYGNATGITNYSFSDNIANMQSGIIYYRLRSVDIDGKSQYSETRIIRIGKRNENTITILTYPNPVTGELRISIPNNWQNKKVLYEVLTANGQSAKRMETASSSQTETVNTSTLVPGFYVVRVSCEGRTAQQKIVKQ